MSKRLQVVVDDAQLHRWEESARAAGLTLSQWVRQALSSAERERSIDDVDSKLSAIQQASRYSFPAPDMEQMLAEIEQGYVETKGL